MRQPVRFLIGMCLLGILLPAGAGCASAEPFPRRESVELPSRGAPSDFATSAASRGSNLAPAVIVVEAGVVFVLMVYVVLVTRRQRQLRLEVGKLRVMTGNAPSCVFRLTEAGEFLDASADVEGILGWKAEEIVGSRLGTIVHPEDLTRVAEDITLAIAGKEVVVRRYRVLCRDGKYKWVETLSHYEPAAKRGRPREIVGVCHDISTRIETQQELAVKDSQLRLIQRSIRESEAKYRTLFNAMHAGFALYEVVYRDDSPAPADFRVLEINPAFEQLTGLRADETLGRLGSVVFASLDEKVRGLMMQVGVTGVANRFVHAFPPTNRDFDVSVFSPKPNQFAAVVIDVTQEHRLERELREGQKQLIEAQRIAGLGYWHYDPSTDAVSYRKQTAEALRLGDPRDTSRPLRKVLARIHPDDREYVATQFRAAVRQGEPFDLVFRVVVGRRKVRYMNAAAKVYYDAEGNPLHVMGTVIDMTERMVAQNELRYQRELFARLIENMPVGAYAKSRGRFILWNSEMERLTGKRRKEVIGRSDHGLFDEAARAACDADDREIALAGPSRNDREETWTTPAGPKQVHLVKVPIVEENGRDVMIFCLVEDVTGTRQMEERLRQSQKMEAVGQLAGGIAHDFNNILQVILGYGELVRGALAEGSQPAEDFGKILDAADKAMTLVRQLLTFSRDEEEKRNRFDLNALIADLVKMIRRVIGDHIELEFSPQPDLAHFVGDPIQVEQLLMNLCINARDAMPDGGLLKIATEEFTADGAWRQLHPKAESDEFIVISVADNGIGMSKEILPRIYEPFFTTKEIGKGTGLGLATVYAIVERHGGTIDVRSEPGLGTTFGVYFPRCRQTLREEPDRRRSEPAELGGNETILLAEDEDTVRALAERTLRAAGYKVISASDGLEAIELFQSHADEISGLVFDVIMPRRTGREAYEAIRGAKPEIPILFCSGCNDEPPDSEFSSSFGGDILQKPYTKTTLLRSLRAVLDSLKAETASPGRFAEPPDLGGLTILVAEE